jgi:hypothetical protein
VVHSGISQAYGLIGGSDVNIPLPAIRLLPRAGKPTITTHILDSSDWIDCKLKADEPLGDVL